jgi:transcriptional regulator with XRE-family HTH domain
MKNNPTIRDVAKAAGVSIATVSRILNDKPDVSVETRQKVLQTVEEIGYAKRMATNYLGEEPGDLLALSAKSCCAKPGFTRLYYWGFGSL